ncbi:Cd(II)/Pb(II)-responsive transcriptional regulator [Neptunomonas qingdaonensis]|uniref:Cd(II)/Pb(II)-responsive transcriptional regulator n=1 Tax=Neptunomonas qingdaonensis TaxID=1045558 RepID=A0A1I2VAJ1_9GAMM|nr:Cd(II)/Pb(II)-responsive transcriptional regulator [Neptunomonas qingdaonensis]SFG86375.1 Cd(II)/Pb(II)-responsive transcriptional regulator [Neptunomonas qingdaonensis]
MKIGELAKQVGFTVETIRYYEKEGLLHPALRDPANNYRRYDHSHLERLIFIRRCRTLAMTHEEIQVLLQARVQPNASCETINELIDEHIHHVQARIAELQILETQLIELRGQCRAAHTTRDCGILRELDHPTEELTEPAVVHSHVPGSQCRGGQHK